MIIMESEDFVLGYEEWNLEKVYVKGDIVIY